MDPDSDSGDAELPVDSVRVVCPYCFEAVEIAIEADVMGSFVQDCEVCCNPWELTVRRVGGRLTAVAEMI